MIQFYERVLALLSGGNSAFALCSVIETKGSTPRHSAKMIVFPDGTSEFTIGGGPAEMATIQAAQKALVSGESTVVEWVLNKSSLSGLNAECGGAMKIHIEVVNRRPTLILIGAGHVNYAVYRQAEAMGFKTVIVDDRETTLADLKYEKAASVFVRPEIGEAVKAMRDSDSMGHFASADAGDYYIVIATKDADESALRALKGVEAAFMGLIGSKRKVGKIVTHLSEEGFDSDWVNQVNMPIGLDIGAETPEEIAISIWAQILAVKNGKSGKPLTRGGRLYADEE